VLAAHHQLGVVDDVTGEDEGAEASVGDSDDLVSEKDAHDRDDREENELCVNVINSFSFTVQFPGK
jgi:hypothetical protein